MRGSLSFQRGQQTPRTHSSRQETNSRRTGVGTAAPAAAAHCDYTLTMATLTMTWLHYGWTDGPGAALAELDPAAPASRTLARADAVLGATEAAGSGPVASAAVAAGAGGGTRGGGGDGGRGFARSLYPRPARLHAGAPQTHLPSPSMLPASVLDHFTALPFLALSPLHQHSRSHIHERECCTFMC